MSNSYITSFYYGHRIYWVPEEQIWRYCDTLEPIKSSDPRPCPKCGHFPTEDGHDHCIQNLPGVKNACCGHGVEEGYIQFIDKTVIRGNFKIEKNERSQN